MNGSHNVEQVDAECEYVELLTRVAMWVEVRASAGDVSVEALILRFGANVHRLVTERGDELVH